MKLTMIALFSLVTLNLIACPGARVELNDKFILTGSGIQNDLTGEFLDPRDIEIAGKLIEAINNKGKTTHEVMILGSLSDDGNKHDKGGVIFTSYLVKDKGTKKEQTLKLNSNYHGNGLRMRSFRRPVDQVEKDENFKSLGISGC